MSAIIRDSILSGSLESVLSELLFESIPHVFGRNAGQYRDWKTLLAGKLQVDPSEVIIIGSAAVGYSLSPHKALKPFDPKSDVDVAVISEHHFSTAWHCLRSIDLTLAPLTHAQRTWIGEHRKRYIYWGTVATDLILPILPFAPQWMPARSDMRTLDPTKDRDVNFRVYKDFRALRSYQLNGLKALKTELLNPGS